MFAPVAYVQVRLPEQSNISYKLTLSFLRGFLYIGEFYDKIIFNLGQINNIQDLKDNLLNKLMSNEIDIE